MELLKNCLTTTEFSGIFENLLDDNGRKRKTSKSGLTITDGNGDLHIWFFRHGRKRRFADFA